MYGHCSGVSELFVLILGSLPVDWIYTNVMGLITFILFKREKKVEDKLSGLEDDNMIVKRKTGLRSTGSAKNGYRRAGCHMGVPPLMQKKKIMKKGSPDGLSFFSY